MIKTKRKMYHLLRKYGNMATWNIEALIERKRTKTIRDIDHSFCGKNMILVPHADDEWIGCSSIIRQGENAFLANMNMQGGDSNDLHIIRRNELQSIAQKYGCGLYLIDEKHKLLDIIRLISPDCIFVPSFFDWHDEHFEVMEELKQAIQMIGEDYAHFKVAMYEVSIPIPDSMITHAIALDKDEWKSKWNEFIKHYKTQTYIPYRRFACNERVNGKISASYAAEVFSVYDPFIWVEMFARSMTNGTNKSFYQTNINSISKIRNYNRNISAETYTA